MPLLNTNAFHEDLKGKLLQSKRTYDKDLYGSKLVMYVERVRTYAKQMPLAEAVEKAVDECIAEGILSEFFRKNRVEAIKVSIYEYDEELHLKTLYEEGVEDGRKLEREQGEIRVNKLHSILIDMG